MINNNQIPDITELLKQITDEDFRNFGIEQIAYIRPLQVDNQSVFAVHSADGSPLSIMESFEEAQAIIIHHDMKPVTVH